MQLRNQCLAIGTALMALVSSSCGFMDGRNTLKTVKLQGKASSLTASIKDYHVLLQLAEVPPEVEGRPVTAWVTSLSRDPIKPFAKWYSLDILESPGDERGLRLPWKRERITVEPGEQEFFFRGPLGIFVMGFWAPHTDVRMRVDFVFDEPLSEPVRVKLEAVIGMP